MSRPLLLPTLRARTPLQRLEALRPGGCEKPTDLRPALAACKPRASLR